jgi:hypothetical protein
MKRAASRNGLDHDRTVSAATVSTTIATTPTVTIAVKASWLTTRRVPSEACTVPLLA